jgi:diadenosine tetraphosphate (Ap4A) HIT family hydrolase
LSAAEEKTPSHIYGIYIRSSATSAGDSVTFIGFDHVTLLLETSCNATKRDRDDTDLRSVALRYDDREANCVFCNVDQSRVVAGNELCLAIRDGHPVTEDHMLVLPKRHVANFFELFQPELNAVNGLLQKMETEIRSLDQEVTGFNVGINVGQDAGQTVFHAHVHLIPRRLGDVENPRGGVRAVIPGRQEY